MSLSVDRHGEFSLTYFPSAAGTARPFSDNISTNGLSLNAFNPLTIDSATICAPGGYV
jgi:hypothetical protein